MKTVKGKQLLVGADFAGYPLKEAVVAHLKKKGWEITDVGVTAQSNLNDTENMFHRVGLRVGAKIAEGEFERALIFCGTGMGYHIAASKCPHVHAGVVESVPATLRAITGNGVNVLAMGAFYVAPQMGCDIADAYLGASLGNGGTIFMSSISSQWTNWKRSTMRPTNGTASGWSISAIIR